MNSLNLIELRAKCISYGLKKSGNKPDLIKRINEFEEKINQSSVEKAVELEKKLLGSDKEILETLEFQVVTQPLDELLSSQSQSSQASSEHESFQESELSKKRVRTTYVKTTSFKTHLEAVAVINEEFDRERLFDTKEGQKERWNCKIHGCPRKCYILFTLEDETVSIWYNDQDHMHENNEKKTKLGINTTTKEVIDKLFRQGTKTPKQVLSVLRQYNEPEIKDSHNKIITNPDYVKGLVLPSSLQIRNYISNTLKPKEILTHFSYSDLANWINEHKNVPDKIDEPYVIDSYINVNDLAPKGIPIIFHESNIIYLIFITY